MRPSRALLLLAVAVTLTGCAGSGQALVVPTNIPLDQVEIDDPARNGIEYLAGPDALDSVILASREQRWVSMVGTFTERLPAPEGERDPVNGLSVAVEVRGSSTDYEATLTAGKLSGAVRVQDDVAVARGNAAFLAQAGLDADAVAVAAAGAEWACLPTGRFAVAEWGSLLDPVGLISDLLIVEGESEISVSTGPVVDDTLSLVVGAGPGPIGSLSVSAIGAPLPTTLDAADASGLGSFTFSEWGVDPKLEEPSSLASCG
ncbi:hypothetical protein EYE40_15280 [Glaciihabitans arcticus]|uniref:Lipoprotein n=1 Tax=Glaciihabitans arcticus TaxID=2668039 RepID=A0A4Q9GM86_9MICO|nr:hypothetical protein [Glaciihabitans arcticus]TBN55559.1 hypothetical protein EYE40_15280 [Glaciihabitans arcticus]